MGQQQLILLALAVVIVGGAIVVGIRAFSENAIKSNADTMMQDAVRVANDLQAWKQKPAPFGGQASVAVIAVVNDPKNYTGATFALLGYREDTGLLATYTNLNGTYAIATAAASTTITGTNTQHDNIITVVVCGTRDDTLAGTIVRLGGVVTGIVNACVPAVVLP